MTFRPSEARLASNRDFPRQLLHRRITTLTLAIVTLGLSIDSAKHGFCADHRSVPNIVLILADDLGCGDLGCYGHPKFKTPRIDRMAAEGARLLQFNTPTAFCAPTRASLLTGRYPFRCGMTQNPAPDGGPAADALGLPQSEITLAQVLRAAGWAERVAAKLGLTLRPDSPTSWEKEAAERICGRQYGHPSWTNRR